MFGIFKIDSLASYEGYVAIDKTFMGKKPLTTARLTDVGRAAFRAYRQQMQQVFDDLPE